MIGGDIPQMVAITFSQTITLGAALIAALIGVSALIRIFYSTRIKMENESLARQLEESRAEAIDKSRRLGELGAEKDRLQQALAGAQAEAHERADQLDKLPRYDDVVRLNAEAMAHVDERARERQSEILEQLMKRADVMEKRNGRMHADAMKMQEQMLANQQKLIEAIGRRRP